MDKQVVKELETLFSFAPPQTLRQSINKLFYSFLINSEVLPNDYKHITEDISFLISFLEIAEEHIKNKAKNDEP